MPAPHADTPAARALDAGDAHVAPHGPRAAAATWAPWGALSVAGLVLLLVAWVGHSSVGVFAQWDAAARAWAAAQPSPVVAGALFLQWIGRGIVVLAAAVVLGVVLAARGRPWAGVTVMTVVLAGSAAATVLKQLVGRGRPEAALGLTTDFSFPSGHATLGAVVACLLVWLALPYARSGLARGLLFAAAALWALAHALARVVLDMHYLSDVIGGIGLGAAASGFVIAGSALLRDRISSEVGHVARQND